MQTVTFTETAASVAAVAAVGGLLYARSSAHAARDAAATARTSVELAERSRRAAERARLRARLERIGELVQEVATLSRASSGTGELSETTRSQCAALHRAVIGIKDLVPRSAALCLVSSPDELSDRAADARAEVDAMIKKLSRHRPNSVYRPRRSAPWSRPSRTRSAMAPGAGGPTGVTRLP
ncbi:MAG: hypothetical protein ABSC30_13085 [Acidimicrobiales bacterium]|jgi:hypothetical protein